MSNKGKQLAPGKRGTAFVLSGPAGCGKTTLVARLMEEFVNVKESVSWTTRAPRPNEVDGEHYHFVTQEEFDAKALEDGFLEHVRLFDCAYGTCRDHVEEELDKGRHVVMVIDVQGALQLKENYPAKLIFIKPPSVETLRERLRGRRTESEAALEKRLERAKEELIFAEQYDYQVVNEDFDKAYEELRTLLDAEGQKNQELEE